MAHRLDDPGGQQGRGAEQERGEGGGGVEAAEQGGSPGVG